MKDLISKVPELKLKHTQATRTVHQADLNQEEFKGMRVGDVMAIDIATDVNMRRWSRANIELYIRCREIEDMKARGEYKIGTKHQHEYHSQLENA